MRIGQWLVEQSYISAATLAEALTLQVRWNAKLADTLLAMRAISPLVWQSALKTQGFETCSLAEMTPDTALLREEEYEHYAAKRFIPIARDADSIRICTSCPDDALKQWCESHYGVACTLLLTPKREIEQFLARHFSSAHTEYALHALARAYPDLSARIAIWRGQKLGVIAFMIALTLCAYVAPVTTWRITLSITTCFYIATLAFKWLLLTQDVRTKKRKRQLTKASLALSDASLPRYSILVPLYKEKESVIKQLLSAIDAMDYPKTQLQVLLITEEDDEETYQALRQAAPPDYCSILRIPPSQPRTKPKACNIALVQATGEFITIYDAEDIPDPLQLKMAVAAFAEGGERLGCLQAPLNYYNREENWLTRLFAVEYSALFTLFLPALRNLHIPIPLGGTSNHIRTHVLKHALGWDPYNVTEDADLGVRLAFMGYRTDILPSITLEEAPISLRAWIKQRSRWIKGYIQTWLVYMRHPALLYKKLGFAAFFGFQLFVGAPALTFLLAPIFWVISLCLLFNLAPALILPAWLLIACSMTLVLGLGIHWWIAQRVIASEQWCGMRITQALYPFYWLLHSFACVKALWQLLVAPHHWEKTSHGKSAHFDGVFCKTSVDSTHVAP